MMVLCINSSFVFSFLSSRCVMALPAGADLVKMWWVTAWWQRLLVFTLFGYRPRKQIHQLLYTRDAIGISPSLEVWYPCLMHLYTRLPALAKALFCSLHIAAAIVIVPTLSLINSYWRFSRSSWVPYTIKSSFYTLLLVCSWRPPLSHKHHTPRQISIVNMCIHTFSGYAKILFCVWQAWHQNSHD